MVSGEGVDQIRLFDYRKSSEVQMNAVAAA